VFVYACVGLLVVIALVILGRPRDMSMDGRQPI